MEKLRKYYNSKYSQISIYAVKTAMMMFVLGLIIYYLSGKLGGALSFAAAVLKPLVLGLVFTYLLSPLVIKVENKVFGGIKKPGTRKAVSVILVFALVIACIVAVIALIVITVSKSVSAFHLTDLKDYIVIISNQFSNFWTTIEQQLASMNISLGSVGDVLGSIFNGVKSGATTILFATIFALYFLIDEKIFKYWGGIMTEFTSEKSRTTLRRFAADADRVFSGYIRGQSMDAVIMGVMTTLTLLIAGIPYAPVIGILTGLGNLVPYVGPVVGFGSLIIVCLAEGSVTHLIAGAVILAVVMFVDANIINPRIVSSNVEVHPVLVIVALLAGGKGGGVVGMLVAVPIAALVKLQFEKKVEKKRAANSHTDPVRSASDIELSDPVSVSSETEDTETF